MKSSPIRSPSSNHVFKSAQIGPGSAVPADVGHGGPCSRGTLEFLSVSALGHTVLSKRFRPSAPRRRMVLKKWIPSSPCPRKK